MNGKEACLVCRHCVFVRPPDWSPDPDQYGDKEFTTIRIAIQHIQKTERHIPVDCSLYPVRVRVTSNHHCGAFERATGSWAGDYPTIHDLIHGTYLQQWYDELKQEVAQLKRQLQATRRISASRLARLQKLKPGRGAEAEKYNSTERP